MEEHPACGAAFDLRLLGGFTLRRAASTVSLPISLQRLIAFLALRGPAPRRTTAGVLWPSTSDERSLASLRTAVWRLRQTASGLLAQSGEFLALDQAVRVDVASIDHAAGAPPGQTCAELLPGWYDDWVLMDRERLRHRQIRVLERSAIAAIDAGDPAALDRALDAAAADPLRESAHRLVIRALLADGNVDAARRHLRFVQGIFREQLGVAPSDQLTALFQPAVVTAR